MSKRERQTAFLKTLVLHAPPTDPRGLLERIAKAERDERCSRRAVRLVLLVGALAVFAQFYLSLLAPTSLGKPAHFANRSLSALSVASLISCAVFLVCWFWHRALLDGVHEESRRFILASLPVVTGPGRPAEHPPFDAQPAHARALGRGDRREALERDRSYWDLFAFRRHS
jgi:hypothetical protein